MQSDRTVENDKTIRTISLMLKEYIKTSYRFQEQMDHLYQAFNILDGDDQIKEGLDDKEQALLSEACRAFKYLSFIPEDIDEICKLESVDRSKNKGCDVYLMSKPEDEDYKISDKKNLYLYKDEEGQVFYYIKDNKEKKYLRIPKLDGQKFNSMICGNTFLVKHILDVTSALRHTKPQQLSQEKREDKERKTSIVFSFNPKKRRYQLTENDLVLLFKNIKDCYKRGKDSNNFDNVNINLFLTYCLWVIIHQNELNILRQKIAKIENKESVWTLIKPKKSTKRIDVLFEKKDKAKDAFNSHVLDAGRRPTTISSLFKAMHSELSKLSSSDGSELNSDLLQPVSSLLNKMISFCRKANFFEKLYANSPEYQKEKFSLTNLSVNVGSCMAYTMQPQGSKEENNEDENNKFLNDLKKSVIEGSVLNNNVNDLCNGIMSSVKNAIEQIEIILIKIKAENSYQVNNETKEQLRTCFDQIIEGHEWTQEILLTNAYKVAEQIRGEIEKSIHENIQNVKRYLIDFGVKKEFVEESEIETLYDKLIQAIEEKSAEFVQKHKEEKEKEHEEISKEKPAAPQLVEKGKEKEDGYKNRDLDNEKPNKRPSQPTTDHPLMREVSKLNKFPRKKLSKRYSMPLPRGTQGKSIDAAAHNMHTPANQPTGKKPVKKSLIKLPKELNIPSFEDLQKLPNKNDGGSSDRRHSEQSLNSSFSLYEMNPNQQGYSSNSESDGEIPRLSNSNVRFEEMRRDGNDIDPEDQMNALQQQLGEAKEKAKQKAKQLSFFDRHAGKIFGGYTSMYLGGMAGAAIGGGIGFLVGTFAAPFTFGASIPLCTLIGVGSGGAIGAGTGFVVGTVVGTLQDEEAVQMPVIEVENSIAKLTKEMAKSKRAQNMVHASAKDSTNEVYSSDDEFDSIDVTYLVEEQKTKPSCFSLVSTRVSLFFSSLFFGNVSRIKTVSPTGSNLYCSSDEEEKPFVSSKKK